MPDRLSLTYAGAAFLVAVGVSVSSPAMAGFQWIAPSDAAAAPPMSAPQELGPTPSFAPPPAAAGSPEIISPVVITGNAPAQTAPAQPADNAVVLGFAKSVPLAVALRQILPNGYAFSVDQNVDMGTLVSFQGGRSWRDTLRDALAPAGLVMREEGQMISIGYATAPAPAPMEAYQKGTEPKSLTFAPIPEAAAAPPAPMEVPALQSAGTTETWSAERGDRLRKTLEDWSRRANVEFDWLSEYDYPLQASVSFSGGFQEAVRTLLSGFEGAHPQPVAELHDNPGMGQMVLVVRTRGNPNSD
jgi:hypothetical protein